MSRLSRSVYRYGGRTRNPFRATVAMYFWRFLKASETPRR